MRLDRLLCDRGLAGSRERARALIMAGQVLVGEDVLVRLDGSGTSVGTRVNKAVTLRISCDVSGAGGFNLTGGLDGAGRLILSGANTYTGPTIANSGVLLVNGSTAAASAVTMNGGGILAGMVGVYLLKDLGLVNLHIKSTLLAPNILGGAIFGVGMLLLGF